MAESFDNMNFNTQKMWSLYYDLKGNGIKKSEFGKY